MKTPKGFNGHNIRTAPQSQKSGRKRNRNLNPTPCLPCRECRHRLLDSLRKLPHRDNPNGARHGSVCGFSLSEFAFFA